MKNYKSFAHLNTGQNQAIIDCLAICKACSKMCIEEGHKKTASLCNECADVCELTFNFICTKSSFTNQAIEFCADICKTCAKECDKMHADHCKECAEACRRCSEACEKIAT